MITPDAALNRTFFWLNQPEFSLQGQGLQIRTCPDTDFWQNTHYGFQHDNGHCLLTILRYDFSISVRATFEYRERFDQCGLMLRHDAENWIKVSTEFENKNLARLGSVVTNRGYSDWAMQDIDSPVTVLWYRIQSKGSDFLLEYSRDGALWSPVRICHLQEHSGKLQVGVYACSPGRSSFTALFDNLLVGRSTWQT